MEFSSFREFMIFGGCAVTAVVFNALVYREFKKTASSLLAADPQELNTGLDVGSALATALAAYIAAVLGLDLDGSGGFGIAVSGDTKLSGWLILGHLSLTLGYFVGTMLAFFGAIRSGWGNQTPALLRAVGMTLATVLLAIVAFMTSGAQVESGEGGGEGSAEAGEESDAER